MGCLHVVVMEVNKKSVAAGATFSLGVCHTI